MKRIISTIILSLGFLVTFSQQLPKGLPKAKSNKIRCFTDQALKAARLSNPNIETDEQFETWLAQKTAQRKATQINGSGTTGTITNYYLPIVFHIIHSGEAVGTGTNISQALINAQVTQLNRDFSNLSGSPYSVASSTGIKFGLATENPTGTTLAEPGIDRIYYASKGWSAPPYDGSTTAFDNMKAASIWDPTRYVNVWICDQSASGLLGIATFPGSSTLSGLDNAETNTTAGVVIEVTSVGSKFTSPDCGVTNQYDMGRTVTHELGHFFGLRHIWGDATTCSAATDYCNDTPKSLYENYGKPAHPKPNTCGTADEMFENYMDYSDDQVLNTFTVNQTDRIQTVMLNSPRRVSLATSTVGKWLPTDNTAGFDNCMGVISVSEKGTAGTTNRYTDINIPITTASSATGNATLTITTSAITGTNAPALAVNGVDYQILTPTVDFTGGDIAKNITVRIIDNAKVDGRRGIALSYTISGSGVTASASLPQTMNIIINDDDDIIIGQNTINLLNESFSSGSMPTGWTTFKSSGYGSQWVVGSNGTAGGTSPNAYVSSNAATKPNTYTTTTSSDGAVLETPLIEGYRVSTIGNLSFKFKVKGRTYSTTTGTGHYGKLFFTSADDPNNNYNDYGTATGNAGNGPWANTTTLQTGTPTIASAFLNNSRFYIDFYWSVTSTSSATNPGLNIDDVVLAATPWNVETTVSNSYTFNTQTASTNIFRNAANNKVIASVTAQNGDVASVVASITEAGTDRPTFTTGGNTFYRSRKAFKITPSAANTTTQNTVTLYFTQAELGSWSTGYTTAKIMKIDDGVNLATGNITTANATIASTSVTDKSATDGYVAFTATFNGYGQYVLVEQAAILPLQWGLFTGILEGNKVALKWNTYNETNNSGFDVERSTNNIDFAKIGFVKALNNKTNNYGFDDANIQLGNRYNYRLKQVDNNGKSTYSSIISILYTGKDKFVNVYPNPFSSMLSIVVGNANLNNSNVVIRDISGKVVYINNNILNNILEVSTSNWSKGTYFISIKTNDDLQTFKIVKD